MGSTPTARSPAPVRLMHGSSHAGLDGLDRRASRPDGCHAIAAVCVEAARNHGPARFRWRRSGAVSALARNLTRDGCSAACGSRRWESPKGYGRAVWRRGFAARGVMLHQADCLIAAAAVSLGAILATQRGGSESSLLHGFTKKTRQSPRREIEAGRRAYREVQQELDIAK